MFIRVERTSPGMSDFKTLVRFMTSQGHSAWGEMPFGVESGRCFSQQTMTTCGNREYYYHKDNDAAFVMLDEKTRRRMTFLILWLHTNSDHMYAESNIIGEVNKFHVNGYMLNYPLCLQEVV